MSTHSPRAGSSKAGLTWLSEGALCSSWGRPWCQSVHAVDGYGDPAGLMPRSPRFAFDEMAKILSKSSASTGRRLMTERGKARRR
jgi:hypothetical protein